MLRPFDYGLQGLLSSGGARVLHFDGTWNENVHCSHLHQQAQRLADTTSGTQHDDLALRKVRRRKAAGASYCEGLAGLQQGVHGCKGIVRPGGEEVSRTGAARRLCDRGAVRRNLAIVRKRRESARQARCNDVICLGRRGGHSRARQTAFLEECRTVNLHASNPL